MSLYEPLRPGDPTHLGRYELLGRLGEGGMGVVFLGQDDVGPVAIKIIKGEFAHDQRRMRRFRREVEAARRVPRYCTAQVYEFDLDHEPPFIVVEYVKGPTLREEVAAEGPLSASRLYGVAIGVAAALSEIHLAEVVHGDLTPSNVLLPPYGPRVIDFGIARVPEQTASTSGEVAGTPAYMAPEHFKNPPVVTAAADVFAWGSVIAFAGTGRSPFGEGPVEPVAMRILNEPPDLGRLDGSVRPVVEAALRKQPRDRPTAAWLFEELKRSARTARASRQTTVEVGRVLGNAQQGSDRRVPTVPVGAPAAQADPAGFPPRPLGVALAVVAVLLALGVWLHPVGEVFGTPGALTNLAARGLFGYGAYALPFVLGGWAVGLLRRPRTARLWPSGRAALERASWERTLGARLGMLWDAARAMWRAPLAGGPVVLLLGAVGLLHLARGAPPVGASYFEHSESGGLLGAALVRPWIVMRVGWLAVLLGLLSLLAGAARTAWPLRRRWGAWQAAAAALLCLAALAGPTLYLRGHHYRYWVKVDPGSHQLAVVRGLDVRRARLVERTPLAGVPAELLAQLRRGVPADGLRDALRLAGAMRGAYRQAAAGAKESTFGGTKVTTGTCLDRPEAGAAAVRCDKPHGAEVYGVAAVPYHRFPETRSLREFAEGACKPRFKAYVGVGFDEQSGLVVDQLVPTTEDWSRGARAVACLLKPAVARTVPHPVRGSQQVFFDDFSQAERWAGAGDSARCETSYDGGLYLGKGEWVQFTKKQAGLLCAATPLPDTLDAGIATNVQLSVHATLSEDASSSGRMGFVCREGEGSRYHLTTTLDGTWWIEKKLQGGGLVTLAQGMESVATDGVSVDLRAVCRDRQDGSVELVLSANGKRLGRAVDPDALQSGTVGVATVAGDPEPFHAYFNDFAVTAPGAR